MKVKKISREVEIFRGRSAPEPGVLLGYGAIIDAFNLPVPIPDVLALRSLKRRSYRAGGWTVYSSNLIFEDTLYKHLTFALKYEGVQLLIFKKIFEKLHKKEVEDIVNLEHTGKYARKIWFLYEWLMMQELDLPDLKIKNYELIVNTSLQYAPDTGERSVRHRIINNLPGTRNYCPLIRKTESLEGYIHSDLGHKKNQYIRGVRKDILQRASAFLLLKDSKASFSIEGESPKSKRAARWGQAIGQAGRNELTGTELVRLQQIVIENDRFVRMGFRNTGGFIGEHDRISGKPLPEHISARWQDVSSLTDGLISTNKLLLHSDMDAVLSAAIVSFGFVFIHPFEDGNGRIHRYLIHHILARKGFSQQGIIFPVSASILDRIGDYHAVLSAYSRPLLDYIEWTETTDHNVEVDNETIDYYRYFDATAQAEFLYGCVSDTIERIIPEEIEYLNRYDTFKRFLDDEFEMPDKTVALLVRFLEQNDGTLSQRARLKEFQALGESEIKDIEAMFRNIFLR